MRTLGVLLLVAAAAKSFDPLLAVQRPSLLRSAGVLVLLVEVEIVLGMWFTLAPAVSPVWTWRVAVGWFAMLTAAAAWFTATGQSCGCFGRVAWLESWHLLVVDAVAVVLLWCCRPRERPARSDLFSDPDAGSVPVARLARRRVAAAACTALVASVWLGGVAYARAGTAVTPGVVYLQTASAMILEPAEWVGRPFPLLSYTTFGERLAHGRWTVVLYRHDCPDCRRWLSTIEQRRGMGIEDPTVLLEISPYGADELAWRGLPHARLDDRYQWFAETPVLITLENSLVTAVAGKAELENHGTGLVPPRRSTVDPRRLSASDSGWCPTTRRGSTFCEEF